VVSRRPPPRPATTAALSVAEGVGDALGADRIHDHAGVAACLLATTIEAAAAHGEQVTRQVAATHRALTDTDDPDQTPASDPLPIAVTILRDAYARALSHERVARFVRATFAALDETDRNTIVRVLLE
jgi:hypothetical protein